MNDQLRPQIANGLHWVRDELDRSLSRARTLIEHHAENPADPLPLQQALAELHTVRGTASMIQCLGVSTVAEEMKHVLHDLLQGRIAAPDPAYSALLSATVQLADYIDALVAGMEDSVFVLQPVLSELRLARGQPLVTEAELFAAQMNVLGVAPPAPAGERAAGAAQAEARKLLPLFQSSLLHWLKGDADAGTGLGRIGKIAEQIAANAQSAPLHQLWRAVAAVIEGILTRGLDDSLDIKRLMGAAGQQIKLLAEGGENAAADKLGDLAYQLLFHVGRCRTQGPRVSALRNHFQLNAWLPPPARIEQLRQRIRGPSTVLLTRVADEIRRDIAEVKDSIDLAVRSGGKAGAGLELTRERLQRIANTLSTLGLPVLQRVVANQAQSLAELRDTTQNGERWMEIATSILRVELSLESALFSQLRPSGVEGASPPPPELEEQAPHSRDLADSTAAFMREALVNVARLKTTADGYIKGGEPRVVAEATDLLGEIAAGLLLLQSDRAADLVRQLQRYVGSTVFPQVRDSKARADRFADAVAALEYYLEARRDRMPQVETILDGFSRCVDLLDFAAAAPAQVAETAPVVEAAPAEVEPEIRDIFLEEAAEVLAEIRNALPGLHRDAQDKDLLMLARRGFHTLKGSGRMAGALQIGDFGWALENLLNRCLDGSVAVTPAVLEVLDQAAELLPGLIDAFRRQAPADPSHQALAERAGRLAAGGAVEGESDLEMAAIFRDDAREKLESIRHWLAQQNRGRGEFAVEPETVRAFHTLRGAAHVVHAPAISELSGALETYLDSTRGAGLKLSPAALDLIEGAIGVLRDWVEAVSTPAVSGQDAAPWLDRIRELQAQVPEPARRATADRQLAEVFATEALDLVQKIEEAADAWGRSPGNRQAAIEIKNQCHTLLGAALMSKCSAIAAPARALHKRMEDAIAEAVTPEPAFFRALSDAIEGVYQILDRYREGSSPDDDGRRLAAAIAALDWHAGGRPGVVVTPAEPAQALPAPLTEDFEEVIEMPPVEEAEAQPPATVPELITTEALPDDRPDEDAELLAIFMGEAQELLESLDAYCAAWERKPEGTDSAGEIKRVLHTLKGSARMAGFAEIGEISHRLEELVNAATVTGRPESSVFARLHQVSDGLHQLLEDLRRGRIPDARALLAELEAPAVSGAAAEPAIPPAAEAAPVPAAAVAKAAMSEDDELAELFSGEAAELLDTLQRALAAWRRDLRDLGAARDMQRALHTLKGGARMAGLPAMGNAAHELESRIHALEVQGAGDAAGLELIAADLEELQHMHDLLARGEAASLRQIAAGEMAADETAEEAVTAAAPQPVAAAPAPVSVTPAVPAAPAGAQWDPQLFWKPEIEQSGLSALRRETARVPVESLDGMLNEAGEISIYRSRLEEHTSALQIQLNEMSQTITRVREQLRMMDIETEAQVAARGLGQSPQQDRYAGDFDPLEMDRYTRMQELSRALSESVGDLAALHATMDGLASESETLLQQQARINTEVQQGLMRTLMVPFSRQVARLQRVVRQVAQENGKQADVQFAGIESELDRNVLERMTAPLEHLLRNAVVHGIEDPATRRAAGKAAAGTVSVSLRREGTQLLIELRDDGKGLDFAAIRETAVKRGLMPAGAAIADEDVAQFIFEPGFSTARQLTQDAGRGIGMDVVASEVKQLGGTLELGSEPGKGARFLIRLPLNLAISQALLVGAGAEMYAIPLPSVEGIARIPVEQLDELYREGGPTFAYGGHDYRVHYLGDFIGLPREMPAEVKSVSAILVRLGEGLGAHERRVAVVVDQLYGNREVVSKAVGPQVSSVTGVSGATILADGRVVLILDVPALALDRTRRALITMAAGRVETAAGADDRELVMVVDDSITIRRVTERLLLKNGYRVVTAKDGLDAMAKLQGERPAAVLLDIEMPRADGFEVATFIRNTERLRKVPIIMITSRSGDKHRDRAMQIGVDRYLIKPYQEEQLVDELRGVLPARAQ